MENSKKNNSVITDDELYSLDCTIAKFIHPRLIEFRDRFRGRSLPFRDDGTCMTSEEWVSIINEMIFAMEYVVNQFEINYEEVNMSRVKYGMKLFSKHFFDLWD